MQNEPYDEINPAHYLAGGIEAIDVIEAYGLTMHLGNAVKYLLRGGKKPGVSLVQDLRKAKWYLARALSKPALWRTQRIKVLNNVTEWHVPDDAPMIKDIARAFGLSGTIGIGLSDIFGRIMHEGEVMDADLTHMIECIDRELSTVTGVSPLPEKIKEGA